MDMVNKACKDGARSVSKMKQTEIGVIPEDWEVKELVDMVELINGRAYSQNELLSRGKYRVLRVGNFFSSDKWYWSDLELANKFYVENGDLMYAWSASFGPKFWLEEKTIYHYHIWKIDNYRKTDKKFLYHLLVNDKASIQNESQGGTMFHITKEAMEKRKFPLPPLAEQEAIASALSDADAWIESLEQLIDKKRLIKQGAMQTLLTPKEDWEVKKLGEVLKLKGGYAFKSDDFGDFGTPIIRISDINGSTVELDNTVCVQIDNLHRDFVVENGDILIAMSGATTGKIGKYCYQNKAYINQRVGKFDIYDLSVYSKEYLYHSLFTKSFKDQLNKFLAQGAQPNISGSQIEDIQLIFPKSLSEQERIATILSDMDAELEALERQLAKARQIKQGMMQELLTGRTRLV